MTDTAPPRRRDVLAMVAASVALPASAAAHSAAASPPLAELVARAAGAPDLVRLGDLALANASLPRPDQLFADLEAEAPRRDTAGLVAVLTDRTREDFRARRTVSLDGWMLSHTEAALLALAAADHRSRMAPLA